MNTNIALFSIEIVFWFLLRDAAKVGLPVMLTMCDLHEVLKPLQTLCFVLAIYALYKIFLPQHLPINGKNAHAIKQAERCFWRWGAENAGGEATPHFCL